MVSQKLPDPIIYTGIPILGFITILCHKFWALEFIRMIRRIVINRDYCFIVL